MRNRLIVTATLLLTAVSGSAGAGEVIAEFSGSRAKTTVAFETDGPWLLEWRINSEYRRQSSFELNLINAETGLFDSRILQTKRLGNGLKLFRQEGRWRFEVSGNFTDWYLTVEQLTEAEAEQYKPR
ncbi:MAG: hypothetical protein AAFY69_03670 [Pseudomonadota bacterium]